jgi:tetratricopeptide (TPR) repeat protein
MLTLLVVSGIAYAMTPQQRREKSRYFYLAGSRAYALEKYDEAYELYQHAYDIDTTFKEAGMSYAHLQTIIYKDSDYLVDNIYPLMKRYVDAYPEDYQEGIQYAKNVATLPVADYKEGARVLERILKIYPSKTDIYDDLTAMYFYDDELDKCIDALQRFERIEGRSQRTISRYAGIYLAKSDTAGVIRMADEVIKDKPLSYESWLGRASIYDALDMRDSVGTALLRAEELAPDSPDVKDALASYYNSNGDEAMADQKVIEVLRGNMLDAKTKVDYLYQYIAYNVEPEDLEEFSPRVEALYNALYETEGDDVDVLEFGYSLASPSKNYDLTNDIAKRLVAIAPDETLYWEKYILANLFRGDASIVQQIYDDAQKNIGEPTNPMEIILATSYILNNDHKAAKEICLRNVRKNIPDYEMTMSPKALVMPDTIFSDEKSGVATWLQMLGDQVVSLNDTVTGYNIYEQALELDPDNVLVLNNYAYFMALTDDADLDKCLEMSQRTISIDPDNSTYLDTYAYILFKKRSYDRAKLYQEMAIEKMKAAGEDESSDIYDHYGNILYMCHEYEKALEAWQKALELDPSNELIQRKVTDKTYYQK